jgi:uncharacterized protein (TIGR03067 family)
MRFLLLTASAFSLITGCNGARSEAVQRELDRLQGTWIGISYTDAQRTLDARDLGMSLVINGDTFSIRAGDRVDAQGRLALDPKHSPKTIDFLEDNATRIGIYELYGDSLRICYDPTGEERPTKLEVKPRSPLLLFVLQRQKSAPG